MPKLVTMHLRNSFPLLFIVLLSIAVVAQSAPATSPTQNQPPAPQQRSPQPQQAPAQGTTEQPDESMPTGPAPNQPGDTVQVPPAPRSGQEIEQQGGGFVFKKQVEEVVLHATVVDNHQRLVTGLNKGDFQVWEDGQPQQITSFRHEDIPVALGIII